MNCHATVLFLAGTQDDNAEDFDPRFCIQNNVQKEIIPLLRPLQRLFDTGWRYLIVLLFPVQFQFCFHSAYAPDQHQTTGPVGDNNTREDNAEAAVVGIILLPFCFDIWIITGSPQE